eukprot:scaffold2508_cov37-Phaeocystis_antarctica.AAC.1
MVRVRVRVGVGVRVRPCGDGRCRGCGEGSGVLVVLIFCGAAAHLEEVDNAHGVVREGHLVELAQLQHARAIGVPAIEERVDILLRHLQTQHGHGLAELLLGDGAVAVLVPLPEEIDDAHGVGGRAGPSHTDPSYRRGRARPPGVVGTVLVRWGASESGELWRRLGAVPQALSLGVLWSGVVWCGVVWYGVVCCAVLC